MCSLPFNSVNERTMRNVLQEHNHSVTSDNDIHSNNDCLAHIDPDSQITRNGLVSQCKYYDEKQFNNIVIGNSNISMIHTNIRSSQKNLRDFVCSIDNLGIRFNFIVLTEIWGDSDKAQLNTIKGYRHMYDTRKQRNGGGVSLYIIIIISLFRT